jgi:hypothetical protein
MNTINPPAAAVNSVPVVTFDTIATVLVENGYRPIPVPFGKKGGGLTNWQKYQFAAGDLEKFNGWGVGILTANTPAIDIDVRDAVHVAALDALIKPNWSSDIARMIGASPLRIGAAPKMLRVYQLDGEPFSKLATRGFVLPGDDTKAPGYRPHKVEILAGGQQFVAFNQHPTTGKPYDWGNSGMSPLQIAHQYLPRLSYVAAAALIKEFDAYLATVGTPYDPKEKLETEIIAPVSDLQRSLKIGEAHAVWNNERDKLTAALKALDPDMDRATWVKIGAALHLGSDGSEEGFELFDQWSSGELCGSAAAQYAGEGDCLGRWRSYKHRGKTLASLGTIFKLARAAGWIEPPAANTPGYMPVVAGGPAGTVPAPPEKFVQMTEEEQALAAHKRAVAAAEAPAGIGIALGDLYSSATLGIIFVPQRATWPDAAVDSRVLYIGKTKPSKWLAKHRSVEAVIWSPGDPMIIKDRLINADADDWIDRPGCSTFNLYRAPTYKPGDPALAGPWLELLVYVYPNDAEHFKKWFAHRRQFPKVKPNHGLVMGGVPGIGKDSILEPLVAAVGSSNFREATPATLVGRFNPFVKGVILRVSEAHDQGELTRYQFYDRTKIYLASPPKTLTCDEKNMREHPVMNVMGVVFTTNHEDGLYLPPNDRRHYVAWSERTPVDFLPGFWKQYYGWLEGGGTAHVLALLDSIDLSDWDVKADPPKTDAFWTMVNAGRAPEESLMSDLLDALGHPPAVTLEQIIEKARTVNMELVDFLKDRRNSRQIPHRLDGAGYTAVRNPSDKRDGQWKINGKRQTIYARKELNVQQRYAAATALLPKWAQT